MSGKNYCSITDGEEAVSVSNSGFFNLSGATITKSDGGVTETSTEQDNSSFYGYNAGVLAYQAGITISNSTISTTGQGSNGAFAYGSGAYVGLSGVTITCTAQGGHGVDCTYTGAISITNSTITTGGMNSGALATDRGGGTVNAVNCAVTTNGGDSPAIYTTGAVTAVNCTLISNDAEGVVVEGANYAVMTNCTLKGSTGNRGRGVLLYNSESGDATGYTGYFTMTGGTYTWSSTTGPAFYVYSKETGIINMTGVTVVNGSATLFQAGVTGTMAATMSGETLTGAVVSDSTAGITLALTNSSTLTGAIDAVGAKTCSLALDSTSAWNVGATSYLYILTETAGITTSAVTNISSNGYNVYYSSSANSWLGGVTVTLTGGGSLIPY